MAFGTGQESPGFGLNTNQGFGKGSMQGYMPDASGAWGLLQGAQKGAQEKEAQEASIGSQEKIAGMQTGAGVQEAQIGAQAAELPALLGQSRFNTVLPWVQGLIGNGVNGTGGGAFNAGYNGAGQVGQQPGITAAPVYSQDQIQQQVNGQTAANDQQTGTNIRNQNEQLAGKGFGSNSPLASALAAMQQGQNLATNTQNEQQTRWNAAQGNAQQLLAGQQAQEGQFASRQQEDIQRHQIIAGQQNALLAALAGMV